MLGEITIIRGIQSLFSQPFGESFIIFCSRWIIFLFVLPVAATGFFKRRPLLRRAAYRAAFAALFAFLITFSLGFIFHRARPFRVTQDIQLLIPPPASVYSFPSIHSSIAFAAAFALLYGEVSMGLIALTMALLVAFGRVASGVHYPSDVIAGAVVGFLAFLMTRYVDEVWRKMI